MLCQWWYSRNDLLCGLLASTEEDYFNTRWFVQWFWNFLLKKKKWEIVCPYGFTYVLIRQIYPKPHCWKSPWPFFFAWGLVSDGFPMSLNKPQQKAQRNIRTGSHLSTERGIRQNVWPRTCVLPRVGGARPAPKCSLCCSCFGVTLSIPVTLP